MSDQKPKTREEIIQDWLATEQARKRQERRGRRLPEGDAGLTINSLMDAMTIILIFLLINYSVDPLKVDFPDLQLPASTTEVNPEQSAAVIITEKSIIVSDKEVVPIKDGMVDKVFKAGEETALRIEPLFEALIKEATNQKQIASLRGGKFQGLITVIADRKVPYRLLTEVLYTAGQAEFAKFKFAVMKGAQRG